MQHWRALTFSLTHTHTHRERESERENYKNDYCVHSHKLKLTLPRPTHTLAWTLVSSRTWSLEHKTNCLLPPIELQRFFVPFREFFSYKVRHNKPRVDLHAGIVVESRGSQWSRVVWRKWVMNREVSSWVEGLHWEVKLEIAPLPPSCLHQQPLLQIFNLC